MTVLPTQTRFIASFNSFSISNRSRRARLSGFGLLTGAFALSTGALSPAQAASAPPVHLSSADSAKIAPFVRRRLSGTSGDLIPVIVKTDGTIPASVQRLVGKTSLTAFAFPRAGKNTPALAMLNRGDVMAARLDARGIAALAADRHTLHISPDLPVQTFSSGPAYLDYAMEATGINFLQANHNLSGKGVGVAVVDTGIYPHNDLTQGTSRIVGWTDLVQNLSQPYDDNGHGTHVAGLVGGNGNTSAANGYITSLVRSAPSTSLIGVKVLDSTGGGSVSTVIAGINWCIAHKAQFNIRVLNLSVGHPIGESYQTDPLCQACDQAWAAGITVVVAAGNNGRSVPSDPNSPTQYGSITSPGNDPNVITVGAVNTRGTLLRDDDLICTYSSRGPSMGDLVLKPDIVAPGNNIISLAAPGSTLFAEAGPNLLTPSDYGGTGSQAYMMLSGTSMATPIVAGAVALLLEADPTLTPDTIKARLMLSATKTATIDYQSYGAGYLNTVGALALTQVTADHSISPSLTRLADGTVDITNFGWGGNIASENFGWGYNGTDKKITAENFGWGYNGPVGKDGKLYDDSDYLTPQNFGWGDNGFTGLGVFGPQTLPTNVGPTDPALWNGNITPINTPTQTDCLSLLFRGD